MSSCKRYMEAVTYEEMSCLQALKLGLQLRLMEVEVEEAVAKDRTWTEAMSEDRGKRYERAEESVLEF
ncbi:hypothetical protein PVK06_026819 [Gossypium arboreum]|uniref:Uncharacterized protein n=1 Tax=Gossypium arboreum TaxID=29729 RepID=A0ABR0NYP8_GOSAR|nr:hypothetical protein PVK06_026819 [Gossypium arboreum]